MAVSANLSKSSVCETLFKNSERYSGTFTCDTSNLEKFLLRKKNVSPLRVAIRGWAATLVASKLVPDLLIPTMNKWLLAETPRRRFIIAFLKRTRWSEIARVASLVGKRQRRLPTSGRPDPEVEIRFLLKFMPSLGPNSLFSPEMRLKANLANRPIQFWN